jgi:hypothetical protein
VSAGIEIGQFHMAQSCGRGTLVPFAAALESERDELIQFRGKKWSHYTQKAPRPVIQRRH